MTVEADGLAAAEPLGGVRSPLPLYHRLYAILRQQITAGAFGPQRTLPSEAQLMQRYGVSRITAKRALDELAAEGLVARARGRGTVLTTAGAGLCARPTHADIAELRQNLDAIGRTTRAEVLEFAYVPVPDHCRERLRLTPGEVVQRAVRIRHLDDAPFSQSTTYVPEHVGRTYGRQDLEATPLIELIERSGIRIAAADQTIGAVAADRIEASRLGVRRGAPLLSIDRVLLGADGAPVQFIRILYRADRFTYRVSLSREQLAERRTRAREA